MTPDVTQYLLQVYEALYQQWFVVNKDFKKLCKEKDVAFWQKSASKFEVSLLEEGALSSLVHVRNEDLDDLYTFVEE